MHLNAAVVIASFSIHHPILWFQPKVTLHLRDLDLFHSVAPNFAFLSAVTDKRNHTRQDSKSMFMTDCIYVENKASSLLMALLSVSHSINQSVAMRLFCKAKQMESERRIDVGGTYAHRESSLSSVMELRN